MDGAEADRYIASAGPPGNRTRRERERAVLAAIITHVAGGASLSNLPRLARTFSATVATDLSPRETLALALVRLHSKLSIQCGLPEDSTLKRPQSKEILRQFEAVTPPPRKQASIFPLNGCRATALSLRAPAAVIFFGKQALALFPFVPELVAVAIAFDVMFLLVLLGAPQALVGMVRSGRTSRRGPRPSRVDDARREGFSSASVSEVLADRVSPYGAQSVEPRAASAEVVRVNSEIETTLERLADETHASVGVADETAEQEAQATPGGGREPFFPTAPQPVPRRSKSFRRKPSFRRSETLRAALRRLRHGGFRGHPDAAWVLGGAAVAALFGYLISQL